MISSGLWQRANQANRQALGRSPLSLRLWRKTSSLISHRYAGLRSRSASARSRGETEEAGESDDQRRYQHQHSNPASHCVALRHSPPAPNDCDSAVGGFGKLRKPLQSLRREPAPVPAQRQASHRQAAIKGRNPIQLDSAWQIRLQWFAPRLERHLAGSCA